MIKNSISSNIKIKTKKTVDGSDLVVIELPRRLEQKTEGADILYFYETILNETASSLSEIIHEADRKNKRLIEYLVKKVENKSRISKIKSQIIENSSRKIKTNKFDIESCVCASLIIHLSNKDLVEVKNLGIDKKYIEELKLDSYHIWSKCHELIPFMTIKNEDALRIKSDIGVLQPLFISKYLGDKPLPLIRELLKIYDKNFDKIIDSTSGETTEFKIGKIIESMIRGGLDLYSSLKVIDELIGILNTEISTGKILTTDYVYNNVRKYLLRQDISGVDSFIKQSTGIFIIKSKKKEIILGSHRKYKFLKEFVRNEFMKFKKKASPNVVNEIVDRVVLVLPYLSVSNEEYLKPVTTKKSDGIKEISFRISYELLDSVTTYLVSESCSANNCSKCLLTMKNSLKNIKSNQIDIIEGSISILHFIYCYFMSFIEQPIGLDERFPSHEIFASKNLSSLNSELQKKALSSGLYRKIHKDFQFIHKEILTYKNTGVFDKTEIKRILTKLIKMMNDFDKEFKGKSRILLNKDRK